MRGEKGDHDGLNGGDLSRAVSAATTAARILVIFFMRTSAIRIANG